MEEDAQAAQLQEESLRKQDEEKVKEERKRQEEADRARNEVKYVCPPWFR